MKSLGSVLLSVQNLQSIPYLGIVSIQKQSHMVSGYSTGQYMSRGLLLRAIFGLTIQQHIEGEFSRNTESWDLPLSFNELLG